MSNETPNVLIQREGYGTGALLVAFLAGAAAGAVVALLTAPTSGADTRARLKGYADDARDQAGRMPEALRAATAAAKAAFDAALKDSSAS